jgi:hypothetical protein
LKERRTIEPAAEALAAAHAVASINGEQSNFSIWTIDQYCDANVCGAKQVPVRRGNSQFAI